MVRQYDSAIRPAEVRPARLQTRTRTHRGGAQESGTRLQARARTGSSPSSRIWMECDAASKA
eukprot:5016081-Pleurochrysis_carterae.AAC.2